MAIVWSRTWPDRPNDYHAHDGERLVGRVYIHDTGGHEQGKWRWFFQADGPDIDRSKSNCSGVEDEKQAAADALKACYQRCRRK